MEEQKTKLESLYQDIEPLKAQLGEHIKTRERLFLEREEVRKKFEGKVNELRTLKRRRDELNRLVKERKAQRMALTEKIRALIETLNKARTSKETEVKRGPDANPGFLRAQLKKLETRVETEALSPDAEKKLMVKIRELKKKLGEMKSFEEATGAVSSSVKDLKTVKKEADDVHKLVQETAKESQVVHEQLTNVGKDLDELKPQEAAFTEQIAKVKEDINAVNKQIEEISAKIRGLKEKEYAEKDRERSEVSKSNEAILAQKEADVNEKIKRGKKLTTDDLLVFQRQNNNE